MAVDDHPMRALKGTSEGKQMMEQVRAHKRAPVEPAQERESYDQVTESLSEEASPPATAKDGVTDSYREIAAKHLGA